MSASPPSLLSAHLCPCLTLPLLPYLLHARPPLSLFSSSVPVLSVVIYSNPEVHEAALKSRRYIVYPAEEAVSQQGRYQASDAEVALFQQRMRELRQQQPPAPAPAQPAQSLQ